jgi:hypothetical protein
MAVEIDQSGKFEQLNTHTVVACANDKNAAIIIAASVKRRLIQKLRKSLIPRKDLVPIAFAVLVYILLKELGRLPSNIVIDEEYTNKESIIKETLTKLLQRKAKGKWQGRILFKQIGKHSAAHKLAWGVHRKKRFVGVKKVTEEEFLRNWI